MIAPMQTTTPDPLGTDCFLALLREVLVDTRAQVFESNPPLAALLRIAERVPDALHEDPESRREIYHALLAFEQRHLGGHDHYTRILRSTRHDDWQLRWDW